MDSWGEVRKRHLKERENTAYRIKDKWAEMLFYLDPRDEGIVPDRLEADFDEFTVKSLAELMKRQLAEATSYKECDVNQYTTELKTFTTTLSDVKRNS